MSRAKALAVAVVVGATGACDALLTEPAPAFPEVAVAFTVVGEAGGGGGTAGTFARVDHALLRFVRPDSASRDTVIRLSVRDGVARARLALDTRERVSALGVYAILAVGSLPVFEGSRIIRVQVGEATSATIALTPMASRVVASRRTVALEVGDTLRLSSAVLFATGDTISGEAGSWASENPDVVFVTKAGLAAGRRPGDTRLLVRYGALADTVIARVQGR